MPPAAVIIPAGGSAAATVEALQLQTRPPGLIIAVDPAVGLDGALRQAFDTESAWVWLLDSGVAPEPEALEYLLAAAESNPKAVLVVSKIISPDGALDPSSVPVPEVHGGERVLSALAHRAVALRVARSGSMLLRRDAAQQLDAQAIDRDLEWTARLLNRAPGLLVPMSVAVRPTESEGRARPRVRAMLRSLAALEPRERPWFAAYFGEQALASIRRRGGG